jgi:hypothetical protein
MVNNRMQMVLCNENFHENFWLCPFLLCKKVTSRVSFS